MILDNPNSFSNLKTAVGFSGYAPWILRKCTLEKVVNLPNICGLRDASASKNLCKNEKVLNQDNFYRANMIQPLP